MLHPLKRPFYRFFGIKLLFSFTSSYFSRFVSSIGNTHVKICISLFHFSENNLFGAFLTPSPLCLPARRCALSMHGHGRQQSHRVAALSPQPPLSQSIPASPCSAQEEASHTSRDQGTVGGTASLLCFHGSLVKSQRQLAGIQVHIEACAYDPRHTVSPV